MSRLLPFPLVSASLLIAWLLLNQALSPGHLILGGIIAIVGGWAYGLLEPPKARIRRPITIVRLILLVLGDILRSNVAVGRIIVGLGRQDRKSGFVSIPLQLRDPCGLAALACIITSTPGTLWVGHDLATGLLTIHVLDLTDESEWVRTIKGRYEEPLLEIFE